MPGAIGQLVQPVKIRASRHAEVEDLCLVDIIYTGEAKSFSFRDRTWWPGLVHRIVDPGEVRLLLMRDPGFKVVRVGAAGSLGRLWKRRGDLPDHKIQQVVTVDAVVITCDSVRVVTKAEIERMQVLEDLREGGHLESKWFAPGGQDRIEIEIGEPYGGLFVLAGMDSGRGDGDRLWKRRIE